MALIKCPECNKEISSQAHLCPHCGYPVSEKTDKLGTTDDVDPDFPELPSNLSVGSQITNWTGDTYISGELERIQHPNERLSIGKIQIGLCKNGIQFLRSYTPLISIHFSQIISLKQSSQNKSILLIEFWDTIIKKRNSLSFYHYSYNKIDKFVRRYNIQKTNPITIREASTSLPKVNSISTNRRFIPWLILLVGIIFIIYYSNRTPSKEDLAKEKQELINDAIKKESNASRQENNFVNDGDVSHLYGAAEYYKDAITIYYEAIAVEDSDFTFDESTKSHIEYLQSKIKDYYSY